jgi:hypothetical protein
VEDLLQAEGEEGEMQDMPEFLDLVVIQEPAVE